MFGIHFRMDKNSPLPSLEFTHSFLAVAREGSLSGAAAELGLSQPTVGRHIRLLEQELGVSLFQRHPRGLAPTAEGTRLIPLAADIAAAAHRFGIAAQGLTGDVSGTVRITASVFMSHYVMPTIIADLRRDEPGIDVVLIPSDDSENLLFREADIAVRMYPPTQLELIRRHICDMDIAQYATRDYIARKGFPKRFDDYGEHDIVGYDRDDRMLRLMAEHGIAMTPDMFTVRTDNQAAYWALVQAGCGIGFAPRIPCLRQHDIVEIPFPFDIPQLPVWLAVHERLRHVPRIDRVWCAIEAGLQRQLILSTA